MAQVIHDTFRPGAASYERCRKAAIERGRQTGEHPALHYLRMIAGVDAAPPKPHFADAKGYVYFVGGRDGPVKIGFTVDVASRLSTLQTGSPTPLSVLAVVAGSPADERAYHRRFKGIRLHGEWFKRTTDLLAELERLSVGCATSLAETCTNTQRTNGVRAYKSRTDNA